MHVSRPTDFEQGGDLEVNGVDEGRADATGQYRFTGFANGYGTATGAGQRGRAEWKDAPGPYEFAFDANRHD